MANAYYNNTRSFTPGTAADGNAVDDKFDGVASGLDGVDVAVQRAIKMPVGTAGDQAIIGDAVARADKVVGFDNSGNLTLHNSASVNAVNAATSESNAATSAATASTSATNSSTSATNSATSATAAANSATAAATSATNAATSETNSNTSAVNSATSESNASTSATAAANSATNAANSVTAAASSEGNSAESATNAATSASSASTSATNAATSATAAAASEANAATSATSAASSAAMISTRSGYLIPAISYVLPIPAANIVDHDFFDNTQDAAWIDQCADKSWENEHIALGKQYLAASYVNDAAAILANPSMVTGDVYYDGTNFREYNVGTTTRAGSRKFPMRGLVTAESARVIIWDITSGQPEMWMVFDAPTTNYMLGGTAQTSVTVLGSTMVSGSNYGVTIVDFTADTGYTRRESTLPTFAGWYLGTISERNNGKNHSGNDASIVNSTVNSVAITYLPDAPLDDYGMRVPTIAVGTAGGVSVIKHDGSVSTYTDSDPTYSVANWVGFSGSSVVFALDASTVSRRFFAIPVSVTSYVVNTTSNSDGYTIAIEDGFGGVIPITVPMFPATSNPKKSIYNGDTGLFIGTNLGVVLVKRNHSVRANGMVAYLTNTYNTGWLIGDIRRAYLCNSLTADRSVKGGTLTVNGTITETVNAGGVNVYSGFSAANYLSEPSHADWNALGTGAFTVCCWATITNGGAQTVCGVTTSATNGQTTGNWVLYVSGSLVYLHIKTAAVWLHINGGSIPLNKRTHLLATRNSAGIVSIYIDGVSVASGARPETMTSDGALAIGCHLSAAGNYEIWSGDCALARVSSTHSTPEQIKHMYETERKLFEPNAQALLSNSASVSNLRYDKKSGMYAVTNGTNTDLFKDLVRVDSAATGATIATPVTTLSGNRVLAPAVDIGSELAAQIKPDKHSVMAYSAGGVTYNAPMGMKPISAVLMTTGTFVDFDLTPPAFDGFLYSFTVPGGKHQITLETV